MQKGLCPVSFLWRGHGVGGFLTKVSITLILALVGLRLAGYWWANAKEAAALLAGLWLLGKLITALFPELSMVPRRGLEPPRSNLH